MANFNYRLEENIEGEYFVDSDCINCGVCTSIASDFFTHIKAKSYHCISRQPKTPAERDLVNEAMDSCPVEAIGKISLV